MEKDTAHSAFGPQLVHPPLSELRSPEKAPGPASPGSASINSARGELEGRPVTRFPKQLRLHRALDQLGRIDEPNDAVRIKNQSILVEPILITTNDTILTGFGRWRLALHNPTREIQCIEYPIDDSEALQFILAHYQPSRGWNAFVRIRLALTLEPYLQQKALENVRTGGKHKGLTNLSEAQRINVRRRIADIAGTGTGNVDKTRAILHSIHPNIIAVLQNGVLTIHRAWLWHRLSKLQQKEEFARYEEERTRRKVLREYLPRHSNVSPEPVHVIEALRRLETLQPGRIVISTSRSKCTIVILGQDFLAARDE